MIDVIDKLKESIRDLEAEEKQTEDPAEKEQILYKMSCIGSVILELTKKKSKS